jgi:hypothetical protein
VVRESIKLYKGHDNQPVTTHPTHSASTLPQHGVLALKEAGRLVTGDHKFERRVAVA